jgi:serine/threonine protein kinase
MTLSQNTRLGPYEIGVPLDAGGMGEVYQARDTRLDRIVAINKLDEEVAPPPLQLVVNWPAGLKK